MQKIYLKCHVFMTRATSIPWEAAAETFITRYTGLFLTYVHCKAISRLYITGDG